VAAASSQSLSQTHPSIRRPNAVIKVTAETGFVEFNVSFFTRRFPTALLVGPIVLLMLPLPAKDSISLLNRKCILVFTTVFLKA